ncbi:MAG: ABC transporter permease subunit [Lachnospiraceae bacterium]|nr:ABC transporter permease subunit [Lachnospiraceae bacterium]
MRKSVVGSLYRKEILDILRDKKTILMMIVVPLILYPLIFVGSIYLAGSILAAPTSKGYIVGFEGLRDEQAMKDFMKEREGEHHYTFYFYSPPEKKDSEEMLRDNRVQAVLRESVSENRPYYEIAYRASDTDSQTAAGMVETILEDYRDELRRNEISEAGLDPDTVLRPILYGRKDYSSNEENAGYLVGLIVPFLMITSILMGALYPAIDTTAGEKERGTLETLLTLPVNNLELIAAKFLATSTIAMAAALLNILSMGFLAIYMGDTMKLAGGGGSLDLRSFIPAALIMLLCVFVFAMFVSAVCLCACIFARSFKEAQNYTTPLLLLFMIGGMAGMIPQLSLNRVTIMVPVVNVVLLISELFHFHYNLSQIATVLFANLAYTGIAVVIMGRLFSSENILFGDAAASLRLLESRKHMKPGQIPGIGDVILLFSALLIVVLFVGSTAVLHFGLYGLMIEQGLILLLVLLYAWYIRADFGKVLHLRKVRPVAVLSAFLCWAGSFFLIQLFGSLLTSLFPGLSTENAENLVALWQGKPIWLLVLVVAVFPAVCEEAAFRGFLLSALEHKYKGAVAVVFTGLIFGAYHMSLLQFLLIAPLGILLSYVVWKEGGIVLSILIHFLNNLSSLLLEQYGESLQDVLPFLKEEQPGAATAAGLFMAGFVLLSAGLLLLRKKAQPSS